MVGKHTNQMIGFIILNKLVRINDKCWSSPVSCMLTDNYSPAVNLSVTDLYFSVATGQFDTS